MIEDDRVYGTRANEIHPFFRAKRAWSSVKDKILKDYITCYLRTIHRRGRPIILVDAFAGPGRFGDGSEGSPLIICSAIDKAPKRGVGIACLFSDSHPAHRDALGACLAKHIESGVAERPLADFSEALSRALEVGQGATLFFYLDPYGIKDLAFETVKQIYERDASQSTEVLINFNFKTFMRMSGNWSYSDSASEVAQKVKEAEVETVNAVMGGDYWLDIVTDPKLDKIQREDLVVGKYMERVREFFDYTYSVPVKELDDHGGSVPVDDLAKYHLIFGTRSARAVVYMNDVAINALEPYFRQFKDGLLFDLTPGRYEPCPVDEVKGAIITAVDPRPLTRRQIYEAVIPRFFMQRRQRDYRAVIDDLTFKETRLFPDRGTMKRKRQLNDDTLLSTRPWPGGESE
ncbi:MAG: three-Cys-motif partner protein TcmP [Gemmatimonadota bacterium]